MTVIFRRSGSKTALMDGWHTSDDADTVKASIRPVFVPEVHVLIVGQNMTEIMATFAKVGLTLG